MAADPSRMPTPEPAAIAPLRDFWDRRYGAEDYAYGTSPNDFLVAATSALPLTGARVLCLADGEGRNGVWLASRGARVTSLDISPAGGAKARRLAQARGVEIETIEADVCAWDLGQTRWDLIVSIFLHLPPKPRAALHARCLRALAPGGRFVFEAYGSGQLGRGTGGPKEASLLVSLLRLEQEVAPVITPITAGTAPRFDVALRFQGERLVREGPLHDGLAEVVQWVVVASGATP